MTTTDNQTQIDRLRDILDWLEEYGTEINYEIDKYISPQEPYLGSNDDLSTAITAAKAAPTAYEKVNTKYTYGVNVLDAEGEVFITFTRSHNAVCERVKVGTKTIEHDAVDAYTEEVDVFETICPPLGAL